MSLSNRLVSAAWRLVVSSAGVRVLSLITMPVLTQLLAPSAFGIAALATTVVSLASVFGLAGMDMSYVRACTVKSSHLDKNVEAFAWRFVIGSGTLSVIGVASIWFVIAPLFDTPQYLWGFVGVGVASLVLSTMAQARARLSNKYPQLSAAIICAGVSSALTGVSVAYWWRQDEVALVLSALVSSVVPIVVLGGPSLTRLCRASGLTVAERLEIVRIGIPGILTAPAYWVLSVGDRWILRMYDDAESVGIYSVAYGFASIGLMINGAVTAVWTPEMARVCERNPAQASELLGRVAERVIAAFACVWLAVSAGGGDLVRLLTAPDFHGASELIPFIAGGVFFYGVSSLSTASLLYVKRLGHAMWWWLGGTVLCVLANIAFIPVFGRLGAALTQTVSFGVVAVGVLVCVQRLSPLKFNYGRLGSVLVGILIAGLFMCNPWAQAAIVSLCIKAFVWIVVAAVVLRIIAPEQLVQVTNYLSVRLGRK